MSRACVQGWFGRAEINGLGVKRRHNLLTGAEQAPLSPDRPDHGEQAWDRPRPG